MSGLVMATETRPVRITGAPLAWGRDLAWVGAVTGVASSAAVFGLGATPFLIPAGVAGLLGGLFLGFEMPRFLDSARRRLALPWIALRCALAGSGIGGFVALAASAASGTVFVEPLVVACVAGALQFGWFWLPYTVLTVTDRPTWPVVLAACGLAPLLGPLALALVYGGLGLVL